MTASVVPLLAHPPTARGRMHHTPRARQHPTHKQMMEKIRKKKKRRKEKELLVVDERKEIRREGEMGPT